MKQINFRSAHSCQRSQTFRIRTKWRNCSTSRRWYTPIHRNWKIEINTVNSRNKRQKQQPHPIIHPVHHLFRYGGSRLLVCHVLRVDAHNRRFEKW